MQLIRCGSQPSTKGAADCFTGDVRIDPLFTAPAPARAGCGSVTFEPGARSNWHTHPLGQILLVTAGCGLSLIHIFTSRSSSATPQSLQPLPRASQRRLLPPRARAGAPKGPPSSGYGWRLSRKWLPRHRQGPKCFTTPCPSTRRSCT